MVTRRVTCTHKAVSSSGPSRLVFRIIDDPDSLNSGGVIDLFTRETEHEEFEQGVEYTLTIVLE